MIRAITFDVGGTLADGGLDKKAFMRKVVDYLSGLGYGVSPRSYRKSLDKAMGELQRLRSLGREMSFRDFYSLVLSGLGISPTEELLSALLGLYFECFISSPIPGSYEVIRALSGRYELAVISNAISPWPRRFLEAQGLKPYFRTIIISGEVGWRKPHGKVFRIALSRLGVRPHEAIHVGDSPVEDVAGAKAVGMKAVLVARGRSFLDLEVEPDAIVEDIRELPEALKALT